VIHSTQRERFHAFDASQFEDGSHRLHLNAQPTTYNPNGQPEQGAAANTCGTRWAAW
jgi:hypothetical protein